MPELVRFVELEAAVLRAELEKRTSAALDELAFGVIRLSADDAVVYFSRTEAKLSGYRGDAIGVSFFTELAPCMGGRDFLARVEQARRAGTLDVTFEQVGDYDDAERELLVRMVSASDGGLWICLTRELGQDGRPTGH